MGDRAHLRRQGDMRKLAERDESFPGSTASLRFSSLDADHYFCPDPHEQSFLEHGWIDSEKQNHAVHWRNNFLERVAEQISDRPNLLRFLHEITRPDFRVPDSLVLRVEPLKLRQNRCTC